MYIDDSEFSPAALLLHHARAFMAPAAPLGRLFGPNLTPETVVSGLFVGVYAALVVSGRASLRRGSALFPSRPPFPPEAPESRLRFESTGRPPPPWPLEKLLYRNTGASTAEATASTLASLIGFRANDQGFQWETTYPAAISKQCNSSDTPVSAAARFQQHVLVPFIAADPSMAHDLADECLAIIGWLHSVQGSTVGATETTSV